MDGYKDPYLNGIFDYCNGHPAQRGDYHFHALPSNTVCIAEIKKVGQVLAYAFNGYPLVSPYVCANAACSSNKKLVSSWRVKSGVNAVTTAAWDAHEFVSGWAIWTNPTASLKPTEPMRMWQPTASRSSWVATKARRPFPPHRGKP